MDLVKTINFKTLDVEFGLIGKSIINNDDNLYFTKSDLKVEDIIHMVLSLNLVFTSEMANVLHELQDKEFLILGDCPYNSIDSLFDYITKSKDAKFIYYCDSLKTLMIFYNGKLYMEKIFNSNVIQFTEIKFNEKHKYILNAICK